MPLFFLTESGHLMTWAKYEVFLIITIVPHTYISDYFRSVKPHSGADCKLFYFVSINDRMFEIVPQTCQDLWLAI